MSEEISPVMRVVGYGMIEGIFLALGINVEGRIVQTLNGMFDILYSMIPLERQGIFPIFWIKLILIKER